MNLNFTGIKIILSERKSLQIINIIQKKYKPYESEETQWA